MTHISFMVHGTPKPAGSKRAFALKKGGVYTGRTVVVDDCKKSRDWKTDVQFSARSNYTGAPLSGPLLMRLTFYIERPKSHFGTGKNAGSLKKDAPLYPTSKPDATKLCRAVEDALTHIIWVDDAQVVSQEILKRYGKPGVHIYVEPHAP